MGLLGDFFEGFVEGYVGERGTEGTVQDVLDLIGHAFGDRD